MCQCTVYSTHNRMLVGWLILDAFGKCVNTCLTRSDVEAPEHSPKNTVEISCVVIGS